MLPRSLQPIVTRVIASWVLLALLLGPLPVTGRAATTIVVTSTSMAVADDGACTRIEAITAANTDAASGVAVGECPAGSGADTVALQAGATYTLSGTVTGQGSVPIASALVEVIDPSTMVVGATTTDSGGAYSVTLDEGTYTVRVVPLADSGYSEATTPTVILAHDTVLNITLILTSPVVPFRGMLRDSQGIGVRGEGIGLSGIEGTPGSWSAEFAADGTFALAVPPGTYLLGLSGRRSWNGYTYDTPGNFGVNTRVTVSQPVDAVIQLPPTVDARVTVLTPSGQPLAGAEVSLQGQLCLDLIPGGVCRPSDSGQASTVTTDAAGVAALRLFPDPTPFRLTVTPPFSNTEYARVISELTVQGDTAATVTLPAADLAFRGVLRDSRGIGVRGEGIGLSGIEGTNGNWSAEFAPDGTFALAVPAGTYLLGLSGRRSWDGHTYDTPGSFGIDSRVAVSESAEVVIQLPPTVEARVTVLAPDGGPLAGAQVALSGQLCLDLVAGGACRSGGQASTVTTDAAGVASLRLFPGPEPFRMLVDPPYSESGPQYGNVLGQLMVQGDTATTVTLRAADLAFRGVLRDSRGVGMGDGEIGLSGLEGTSGGWGVQREADGTFALAVPAGTYLLGLQGYGSRNGRTYDAPGSFGVNTRVTVSQPVDAVIQLPPTVGARVTVLAPDGLPLVGAQVTLSGNLCLNLVPGGACRDHESSQSSSVNTDAAGVASLRLFPGFYPIRLSVSPPISAPGLPPVAITNLIVTQDTQMVVSFNRPPTVQIPPTYTVAEGGTVLLSGAASDPDGDPLTSTWEVGGTGAIGATQSAHGLETGALAALETPSQLTYAFSAAGRDGPDSQSVTLRVCDSHGACAAATTTVIIANAPPTASFAAPARVAAGSPIALVVTNPADGSDDLPTLRYAFDCGDGAGFSALGSVASAQCPTSEAGTRTVRGRVRDKDGGQSDYSASVEITSVRPSSSVAGQARDPGGNGVPGVTIFLDANADGVLNANEARQGTGRDGTYRFESVTAGAHTVRAAKAGLTFLQPSRAIIVPPSATVDFELKHGVPYVGPGLVAPAASLTGVAPSGVVLEWEEPYTGTGQAASQFRLILRRVTPTSQAVLQRDLLARDLQRRIGADGKAIYRYTLDIDLAPAAKHSWSVSADNDATTAWKASQTWFFTTAAAATYRIAGRVADGTGGAIGGVTVTAGGGSAVTAADGAYTIPNLAAGPHTVTATKDGCTFAPATRGVVLGPDATGQDFTGTCAVTYSVSGRVGSGTGAGVAGVTIATTSGVSTTTATDGTYLLTLTGGDHTLTPTKEGCSFSPATRAVAVSASLTGQDFTATCAGMPAIVGHARDLAGRPVGGVTVFLDADGDGVLDWTERRVTTAATGAYRFDNLALGDYLVRPLKSGVIFSPAERTIRNLTAEMTGQDFVGASATAAPMLRLPTNNATNQARSGLILEWKDTGAGTAVADRFHLTLRRVTPSASVVLDLDLDQSQLERRTDTDGKFIYRYTLGVTLDPAVKYSWLIGAKNHATATWKNSATWTFTTRAS